MGLFAVWAAGFAPAFAQGFDAHGPMLPPDGGDVLDPVLGFGGALPNAPAVSVLGEAATRTLVRQVTDGAEVTEIPVVDGLFGLDVGFAAGLSERLGVAAAIPVWLGSGGETAGGLAAGDAHLFVPIGLARGRTVSVVAVPLAALPTGAQARFLGERGPILGGLGSIEVRPGRVAFHLDAGADWTPPTDLPDWPGGLHARFAADVGWSPIEALGLHLEARGRSPVGRPLPSVPSELMLGAKVRPEDRWWITAGAGTALTRGPGASSLRMVVGVSAALGSKPVDAEAVASAEQHELHVVDSRRYPIRDATVTVGRTVVRTDHEGYALLPAGRTSRSRTIEVTHPDFLPGTVEVAEGEEHWEIVLARKPVPVAVSAVGPEGVMEGVVVQVTGPADPGDPVVDEAGVSNYELGAGEWQVAVEAPGMGRQERTVVVEEGRTEPIRVDAVLSELEHEETRLVVEVRDPTGQPVEDAVVALGDRTLGTTGPGGNVVVEGLAPGDKSVTVRSAAYGDATAVEVDLGEGEEVVVATLDWQPGSVVVRAEGPDGAPVDALVALSGPVSLPSRSLGSDGEEVLVLRPGEWEVFVSSPTLGTQQRRVVVDEEPGKAAELDFTLRRLETGRADLELAVRDLDGWPVAGAAVQIDGEPVGSTGPDGGLTLLDLDDGLRFVKVTHDLIVPHNTELTLIPGTQAHDLTVSWVTGVVDVEVRDPEGGPADALLAFSGPAARPSAQVGPDGFERLVLAPGAWTVAASSATWGTQMRTVTVVEGDRRRRRVDFQLQQVEDQVGALALAITDPRGRPVDGAEVTVDGRRVGQASAGQLELQQVPLGPVEVVVSAPALQTAELEVEVAEQTALDVPLSWAPGALEVTLAGPDGPVEAMLLISGPEPAAPRMVTGGTTLLALSPGKWSILASHPTLSAPEATVKLPEDPALTELTIALKPVADDAATLVLTVRDPSGAPVSDAQVTVTDGPTGTTSGGGILELVDLVPGPNRIRVSAPDLQPIDLDMDLKAGLTRHTAVLPHVAQVVEVTAPEGAQVTAFGPGSVEPVTVAEGKATLPLAPGAWTLQAREGAKVATVDVQVAAGEAVSVALEPEVVEATLQDSRVSLSKPVLFDLDKADLRPDALLIVDDLARRLLAERSAALIEVQGHTDDRGGVAYNQDLSERRAAAVRDALIARGVPRERLVARGYGLTRPVTMRTDEASRQLNRRVELVVLRSGGG